MCLIFDVVLNSNDLDYFAMDASTEPPSLLGSSSRKPNVGAQVPNIEAQAMCVLSGHFLGYLPNHYGNR